MGPVIKKYCCRKELCDHAPVFWSWFKTSVKVNWFQIGQEILQWERVLSKKELRVSTSSRYSSYSWFIEVFAKFKTKGVILYQHTILMWVTFPLQVQHVNLRKLASSYVEQSMRLLGLSTCLRLLLCRKRWSHPILEFLHWDKFKTDWDFDLAHFMSNQ